MTPKLMLNAHCNQESRTREMTTSDAQRDCREPLIDRNCRTARLTGGCQSRGVS